MLHSVTAQPALMFSRTITISKQPYCKQFLDGISVVNFLD